MVALTKVDRVDLARRQAARQEISALLAPTQYAGASIIGASNTTLEGIGTLRSEILSFARDTSLHANCLESPDLSDQNFRLPIDRVFSIKGAGTIVTGTVAAGSVSLGDQLVEPLIAQKLRVRSIHTQDLAAERATRGQRCALNIVPVDGGLLPIARGNWLTSQTAAKVGSRVDLEVTIFASETKPLQHWTQLHIFHATSHHLGHLATLGTTSISPGAMGFGQLSLATLVTFALEIASSFATTVQVELSAQVASLISRHQRQEGPSLVA